MRASHGVGITAHLKLAPGRPGASLYRSLRELIERGAAAYGEPLPATRTLARELAVSRTTAESAYARLEAEGYLERRRGSGSFVRFRARSPRLSPAAPAPRSVLSRRGRTLLGVARPDADAARPAIDPCTAEEELIPVTPLSRLLAEGVTRSPLRSFRDQDPLGYPPLRSAIARYLAAERGVLCSPDCVMVTSGTQNSIALLAHLLLDPGELAACEDPGYADARAALAAAGARLLPLPLDANGVRVDSLARMRTPPRLVYVTPGHQYPTGLEMSAARRVELLEYAARHGSFIVEDDYDSEFRYERALPPALFAADASMRTFFCGTFNKVLFPSLRLAYVVVPPHTAAALRPIRRVLDGGEGFPVQAAMARFLDEGHFAAHLARARMIFKARRERLLAMLRRFEGAEVSVGPHGAGLHLCIRLSAAIDDAALCREPLFVQLGIRPLSSYYARAARAERGLVIGYGRLDEAAIAGIGRVLRRGVAGKV